VYWGVFIGPNVSWECSNLQNTHWVSKVAAQAADAAGFNTTLLLLYPMIAF